ncbi:MAG: anthranilate phosphoribosyltransferase [Campylobacterales bacterium]|nr:anthranilate phosphoribosyltransferase [Campylobacterales bacterium]
MNYNEALEMFEQLFNQKLSFDEAREFLIELFNRGENYEEIAAATVVMRKHSIKLDLDESIKDKLIDNCGTGGDKSGSFNISTTVSIILASGGLYVAKHGNRSITSKSGSADMLEALGVNLNLNLEQEKELLLKSGFTFLFAQRHHPCMSFIMPIRKSINHRTIFNILGPLSNPANVKKQFIGVFDKSFVPKICEALQLLDTKKAIVVSSHDGLDEISLSDNTTVGLLEHGICSYFDLNPTQYGFKRYGLDDIKGGDANINATITKEILQNRLHGAYRDIVVMNASLAFLVGDVVNSIEDGVELASTLIDSGKCAEKLEQIIEVSNSI